MNTNNLNSERKFALFSDPPSNPIAAENITENVPAGNQGLSKSRNTKPEIR